MDLCADTGECVDICDTLSQPTYVISFRRKRERRSERKEKKKRMKRKLQDLSGIGGSWITVVNFEMDDTRRGDKACADRSLCCLEVK